jgi:hypothetical protein
VQEEIKNRGVDGTGAAHFFTGWSPGLVVMC